MPLCSASPLVERARPLLGTLVAIRVSSLSPLHEHDAHEAIDAAFDEVALIHRCMSFHDPASDVSRMNREAVHRPVPVHPLTFEVLQTALDVAARSAGCFDVTVGAELVDWGLLPHPAGAPQVDPRGSWRDIELLPNAHVRFQRPLWIDLGGIAKGYAVDRATLRLRQQGVAQSVVNAGGDLRTQGPSVERIRLQLDSSGDDDLHDDLHHHPNPKMPVLELEDGSAASSSGHRDRRWHRDRFHGPHVDIAGARRAPARTDRFVCVVSQTCMIADALTKVVMAQGRQSAHVLRQFGATAYLHDADEGWQLI
jgi:thiamine biosynthesis lipoprotein